MKRSVFQIANWANNMVAAMLIDYVSTDIRFSDLLVKFLPVQTRTTTNLQFPEFKTTGDEKHDLETYIENLIDTA